MNQHQLIEIIGIKDVVTIIQSYMCGTPLKKAKPIRRVYRRDSYSSESEEEEKHIIPIHISSERRVVKHDKAKRWIRCDSSDSEIREDIFEEKDMTNKTIEEKLTRVMFAKKQSIKIDHNVNSKRREILGIPNVPRMPVYGYSFKPEAREYQRLNNYLDKQGYWIWDKRHNIRKGKIEFAFQDDMMEELLEDLADLLEIYEFTKREISRDFYTSQDM